MSECDDARKKANIERVIAAILRCPACGSDDECGCTEKQKDDAVREQWRANFARKSAQ